MATRNFTINDMGVGTMRLFLFILIVWILSGVIMSENIANKCEKQGEYISLFDRKFVCEVVEDE